MDVERRVTSAPIVRLGLDLAATAMAMAMAVEVQVAVDALDAVRLATFEPIVRLEDRARTVETVIATFAANPATLRVIVLTAAARATIPTLVVVDQLRTITHPMTTAVAVLCATNTGIGRVIVRIKPIRIQLRPDVQTPTAMILHQNSRRKRKRMRMRRRKDTNSFRPDFAPSDA